VTVAPIYQLQPGISDIILDSVNEGVFTIDHQRRITSFNRAAETITGVPRLEAIGMQCCDVFRANICDSECAMRFSMETGQSIVNKAILIIDRRGRKVPIRISSAVLRDERGRIVGGVETFRDLSELEQLRKELEGRFSLGDIIGRSRPMRDLFGLLPSVAASNSTVVIEGASGTGKELFARAIHELSPRRANRFVAINCGALPDTLLESELFGYKAGAFTDARVDKPGRFAAADRGTIFLDEIADISPAMQVRLLRVLQERVYEPLGSVDPIALDVRVVVATHSDLAQLVREGSFREDLYYRINVVRLELPSLRERREDIPLLVDHFVERFNRLQEKGVRGISDEVLALLMSYDFPGNARELENVIEHAFVLCSSGLIELDHLPPELKRQREAQRFTVRNGTTLRSLEALHIANALRRNGGNRTAAAKELGIHPSTLFRKIKDLGIVPPDRDGRNRDVASSTPAERS
jgi:PAS domain S-box-containing protein